jgi:hypothetical protein
VRCRDILYSHRSHLLRYLFRLCCLQVFRSRLNGLLLHLPLGVLLRWLTDVTVS